MDRLVMAAGRAATLHPGALALALLSACGGGSAANLPTQHRHTDGCGAAPSADADGHVEVYLSLWDDGAERPFCPGDHLRPEDSLQVRVEVVREAHVYMLYVDPRGESGTLERQDTGSTTRLGIYRIPAGLLTRHAGEAQLFLIVSLSALGEADPAMHQLWQAIHETGAFVDREGHLHPPHHAGARSTPLHFEPSAALHANFDAAGVAMLALSLRAGG